jgi:hypothetical protein
LIKDIDLPDTVRRNQQDKLFIKSIYDSFPEGVVKTIYDNYAIIDMNNDGINEIGCIVLKYLHVSHYLGVFSVDKVGKEARLVISTFMMAGLEKISVKENLDGYLFHVDQPDDLPFDGPVDQDWIDIQYYIKTNSGKIVDSGKYADGKRIWAFENFDDY